MTNIYKTELFPYIEGAQLNGKNVSLTIANFAAEEITGYKGRKETSYVLYFVETSKKLILNKTNARVIAELYGADTENWIDKQITLYPENITVSGIPRIAIRIRGE